MPRPTCRCPLCGTTNTSKADLIKHVLEEVRKQVNYKCTRCGWKRPEREWSEFDSDRHVCCRDGKKYFVEVQYKTLEDVKIILSMTRDIHAREIDDVARQVDWCPPRNAWSAKRKRVSKPESRPKRTVLMSSPQRVFTTYKLSPISQPGSPRTPESHQSAPATKPKPDVAEPIPSDLTSEIGPAPMIALFEPGTVDAVMAEELIPANPSTSQATNVITNVEMSKAQTLPNSVPQVEAYDPTKPEMRCPEKRVDDEKPNPASGTDSGVDLPPVEPAPGPNQPPQLGEPEQPMAVTNGLEEFLLIQKPSISYPATGVAPCRRYSSDLLPYLPNCRTNVGVIPLSGETSYFTTPGGVKYMMFPTWHRATATVCVAMAPARNCSEACVFRDCPELSPYTPAIPADLDWIQTVRNGAQFVGQGTLLCPFNVDLEQAFK